MKKILATLLLLILSTVAVMGQPGRGGVTTGSISSAARSLVTGATLPVTCTVGDVYYKTGAGAGSYNCTATNTWALITAPSAPIGASYVTNVAEAGLTGEQALSLLSSGIMRVNTTTGVISSLTDSAGIANNISDEVGSGKLVLDTSPTIATPIFSTSGTFGLAAADDPIIIDPVAKGGASKTLTITSVDLTDNRIATFQNVTGTVYVSGGTDVPVTDGGLGLSAVAVGEIPYGSGVNTYTTLPADTSDIRKFLREISIVGVAQIPGWDTVTKTDVGLSNVENTALSTWAGTINIVNLGAFTAGAPVTLGDSATYDPIIVSPAVKGAASKTLTISTNDLTDNRQATFQDVTGTVYVSGGTDVPVTDGGTGVSTLTTAYGLLAAGTTATGNVQTLAAGATTQILVGGGASALPAWGTDIPTAVTIGTAYIHRVGGTDVAVADGGTGKSVFVVGDIVHATGTTTLAGLANVATGSVLVSGGVGAVSTWSASPTLTTSLTTPTVYGSVASGGNLTLHSTVHSTKGLIYFGTASAYDQVNDRFGIGTTGPGAKLQVSGQTYFGGVGTAGDFRLYSADAGGTGSYITFANSLGTLTITGGNGSASTGNKVHITSNLYPTTDDTYDLGTTAQRWKTLFVGTGGATIEGNVGIGTPTVDTARLVAKSTTTQLALRYNEGAPNVETLFTTSSGGDLTIAPSGGDTSITGTLQTTAGGLSTYHALALATSGYALSFFTDTTGSAKATIGDIGVIQSTTNTRRGTFVLNLANDGAPAEVLRVANTGLVTIANSLTLTAGTFTMGTGYNINVGGTAVRGTTASTNSINVFDGTAPVGTLANGITLYSTAGEGYIMDAGGTATQQTSHDRFTGEWIFHAYNVNTGEHYRVDMEQLVIEFEKISGKSFTHRWTEKVN